MHAARAMAGIVEIMHHREWQAIAIGKPFDRVARLPRHRGDDRRIGFVFRLA